MCGDGLGLGASFPGSPWGPCPWLPGKPAFTVSRTERLLGRPGPRLHSCVCAGAGLGAHDPRGAFH